MRRVTGKTQHPVLQIGKTFERVKDLPASIEINGVDGEVAAGGVRQPVITETHPCMATISFQIDARLRDLDRLAACHHGHGTMRQAGIDHPQPGITADCCEALDRGRHSHIDITDVKPGLPVANSTADDANVMACICRQHEQTLRQRRDRKIRQLCITGRHRHHC